MILKTLISMLSCVWAKLCRSGPDLRMAAIAYCFKSDADWSAQSEHNFMRSVDGAYAPPINHPLTVWINKFVKKTEGAQVLSEGAMPPF